jgi:hypothetical protein
MSLRTFLSSTFAMSAPFRRVLFRFLFLWVSKWLAFAFDRFTFPLLVSVKRLAAPLLVFNLGIALYSPEK